MSVPKIAFGLEHRPLKLGVVEIQSFILTDKQTVFVKSTVQKALGYEGKSDHWLADLLQHIHKFLPIDSIITEINNPIVFEITKTDQSKQLSEGFAPRLFLDVCKVIVLAKKEGFLNVNQLKFSKAAEFILSQLNESNIEGLVAESTGYKFYVEQSIDNLEQFLTNNLYDNSLVWTKTLPTTFYEQLFEIHASSWQDLKENPQNIGRIIHETVFSHLPNDLLHELRTQKPIRNYKRKGNKSQDTQHPELKIYILNLLALMKAAGQNWNIFLQLLNRSYPRNNSYNAKFPLITNAANKEPLSDFNRKLLNMT